MRLYRRHILLILSLVLFSCQNKNQSNSPPTDLYPSTSHIENGGTLVVGIRTEPETLNPLFALSQASRNVIGLLFLRLADINADLETFSPRIAKSWEISLKKRQIVFHLYQNIRWHDGHPLTAEDVVFTHQMHINPVVGWDGISYKQNISNVTAPDDSTVIFTFHASNRTMLSDAVEGYILPKHLLQPYSPEELFTADFNRQPVGAGPFAFVEWQDQQLIRLSKNKSYFKASKPHLDRVIFRIVPDNFNLLNQLKSGEVDMVEGIHPKNFLAIQKSWQSGHSDIRPIRYLGRRYDFIGWNLIDPVSYREAVAAGATQSTIDSLIRPNKLFGNQKVRAALTMAIDRKAIMNSVNFGMAVPLNGPVPPILPSYNEAANVIWEYNPEKSRKWLAELGWADRNGDKLLDKDGVSFQFEILTESGNLHWEQVATIVQAQLAEIGIQTRLRFLEPALLYGELLPKREFDAVIMGWTVGLTPDYAPLFHSDSYFTPFHFTGYYSPEYDRLDNLAKSARTKAGAQPYYDKIARLLSRELPYTWLYYRMECSAVHSRFKNIVFDKRGLYVNLEDWWIPRNERLKIDKIFEN